MFGLTVWSRVVNYHLFIVMVLMVTYNHLIEVNSKKSIFLSVSELFLLGYKAAKLIWAQKIHMTINGEPLKNSPPNRYKPNLPLTQ